MEIPHTVHEIGENAFSNCCELEKIIFEENSELKNIKDEVFNECIKLT